MQSLQALTGWWKTYKQSKIGVFGLAIVIIFVVVILLAPYIATHNPREMTVDWFQPPSWNHLLGTTSAGQDVFSRLLYAGRISLTIGFIVAASATFIATTLGLIAGYFGGVVDELVMRVVDIILILPRLALLIVLAAYLRGGMWTMILLLTVTGWAGTCRQVRAQTLSCKEYTFVEAARAVGASSRHIIWNHILPNVAGIVIANFAMAVVIAILMESGLSFLGLGDPTRPTWGIMLYFAQQESAFSWGAWWWFLPPGACVALLGIGFAYIGNTLNDRFVLRLGIRRR